MNEINCKVCKKVYTTSCDHQQGRCPYHPSMLEQILNDPYKSRFYNLFKFLKVIK